MLYIIVNTKIWQQCLKRLLVTAKLQGKTSNKNSHSSLWIPTDGLFGHNNLCVLKTNTTIYSRTLFKYSGITIVRKYAEQTGRPPRTTSVDGGVGRRDRGKKSIAWTPRGRRDEARRGEARRCGAVRCGERRTGVVVWGVAARGFREQRKTFTDTYAVTNY